MNNHHRNSKQIENEIEHARVNMSETLDEIQSRLSPGRLLDQALDVFSGKSTDNNSFTSNLTESVKQNPIPTTLIGLGVGWLMMSGKSRSSVETNHYPGRNDPTYPAHTSDTDIADPRTSSYQDTSDSSVDQFKDKASSLVAGTKDKIGAAADSSKEKLGSARDSINHQASFQAERAEQNFNHILREQPMVLIGAGLSIGAALGAGLPATRREDRLMGETRDNLVDQAASVGNEYLEKTKAIAISTVNAAAEEAEREGLTPKTTKDKADEIKDSTKRVVNAGKEAAKKEADKQGVSN